MKPEEAPQDPSVEAFKAPVGFGADDEVAEEARAELAEEARVEDARAELVEEARVELGLVLEPQLPRRGLQPVPQ